MVSVLGELKRLKRIQDGDTLKFVRVVKIVECAWWIEVEWVCKQRWTMTTNYVEKLLPPIQRTE